jgi:hypothetical protein
MITLLQTVAKVSAEEKEPFFYSYLFWIAVIEFLIIVFLIYKIKSKNKITELSDFEIKNITDSKNNPIDMDNLMSSIHNAKQLYKELAKKCHPDRFVNNPKQKNAEEIFQEISKNERNFENLSALKLRAIRELDITF